jgi:hypothetical protein
MAAQPRHGSRGKQRGPTLWTRHFEAQCKLRASLQIGWGPRCRNRGRQPTLHVAGKRGACPTKGDQSRHFGGIPTPFDFAQGKLASRPTTPQPRDVLPVFHGGGGVDATTRRVFGGHRPPLQSETTSSTASQDAPPPHCATVVLDVCTGSGMISGVGKRAQSWNTFSSVIRKL